jgi:hypothetical protein
MSPARQEELTSRLETVLALGPAAELSPDRRLLRVHYDWLETGEVAQRTVARLSQQLRRYLDDRVLLENRRIMEILRELEQRALAARDDPPTGTFMEIDDLAPNIGLPLQRPLFAPAHRAIITAMSLTAGTTDISTDALYDQTYVDRAVLVAHIRRALQTRSQISLTDLLALRPIEQGLAELVTYMALASDDRGAVIDDTQKERVFWTDPSGAAREAVLPLIVFTRRNLGELSP